jgi:hypothetical protein
LLVEEYSARFERPEDLELPAFSSEARVRSRVARVPPPSRWGLVLGVIGAILVFLLILGLTGGSDNGDNGKSTSAAKHHRQRGSASGGAGAAGSQKPSRPARKSVRVRVVATRPVWVCLVDARGNDRIPGQTVAPGDKQGPFRSSAFEVTFGNGGGDLVIDGKRRDTPERSEPTGYSVKPSGTKILPASARPTCE